MALMLGPGPIPRYKHHTKTVEQSLRSGIGGLAWAIARRRLKRRGNQPVEKGRGGDQHRGFGQPVAAHTRGHTATGEWL